MGICVFKGLCSGPGKNYETGVQLIGALHSKWSNLGVDKVLVLGAGTWCWKDPVALVLLKSARNSSIGCVALLRASY